MLQEKIYQHLSDQPYFICKDHTVSHENFEIRYNSEFDMMVTYPPPASSKLSEYYQSEAYISHTDSRRSFFDKVYQQVKSFMLDRKLNWIEKESSGKGELLDIGAGTGDFLAIAKKRGWNITGIEPNEAARNLSSEKGIPLLENSETLASHSFDVITLWHVLEHVPDLEKQISELHRLLKPEGILLIAVPNFKSYDAYKYKENWAAFDVPRHLWHFSRNSIEKIFGIFSFEVFKVEPLKFDSYYVSLLSEKYRSGSRNIFKGIWSGLLSNFVARRTREHSSLTYFLKKSPETRNKAI